MTDLRQDFIDCIGLREERGFDLRAEIIEQTDMPCIDILQIASRIRALSMIEDEISGVLFDYTEGLTLPISFDDRLPLTLRIKLTAGDCDLVSQPN